MEKRYSSIVGMRQPSEQPLAALRRARDLTDASFAETGRGLLETGGSKMAHVKLRSPEEIDEPLLRDMVETAVRLNREKGDPSRVRG